MPYNIKDIAHRKKVAEDFQSYFGVPFANFYDPQLSIFGNICVDLFKFDDFLKSQFKYYADVNCKVSMDKCILIEFGSDAHKFFKELLF